MRNSVKRDTGGWVLVIVLLVLAGCGDASVDDELRRFVEDTAAAAEARDTGYFRGIVGASYLDGAGNDRDRIIDLIRGFFLVNSNVVADADVVSIEVSGSESARIVLEARINGNINRAAPRLELELLRDDTDWDVIGAHWQDRTGRLEP